MQTPCETCSHFIPDVFYTNRHPDEYAANIFGVCSKIDQTMTRLSKYRFARQAYKTCKGELYSEDDHWTKRFRLVSIIEAVLYAMFGRLIFWIRKKEIEHYQLGKYLIPMGY